MMHHFRYFVQFARHKIHVFRWCVRLGVPWRGVLHDLSKLRPSEWFAHARWFGGDAISVSTEQMKEIAWEAMKTRGARLTVTATKEDLNRAWNYHQKRNKHHWQYWVAWGDDGKPTPIPMPDKYRREMLADWLAIYTKRPDSKWYHKDHRQITLHVETRAWVEARIKEIPEAKGLKI